MSGSPARASAAVAGVLAVLTFLGVVVALGAAAGPGPVISRDGETSSQERTPIEIPTASAESDPRPETTNRRGPVREVALPQWVGGTVRVAFVLGALAVLVWLARLTWWWLSPEYERRRSDRVEGDVGEVEDLVRVARSVAEAASEQQRRLASGPPGEAVIACWLEMERALAVAGVVRQPSETSSELTVRVLSRLAADPEAVRRLELRYREARFSQRPVGEAERAEAYAALEAIRVSIGAAR